MFGRSQSRADDSTPSGEPHALQGPGHDEAGPIRREQRLVRPGLDDLHLPPVKPGFHKLPARFGGLAGIGLQHDHAVLFLDGEALGLRHSAPAEQASVACRR